MFKIRTSLFILSLLVIAVSIFTYHILSNQNNTNLVLIDDFNISDNSSANVSLMHANVSLMHANVSNISTDDENLVLPSKETILNGINWSNYSLLRNPYIHNHEISDPTDVVNHKFLYVTIVVEVIDASNETEVLGQISGVAVELQKIIGMDSGPNVWGTSGGIWIYYAAIMPYETEVWARAFH